MYEICKTRFGKITIGKKDNKNTIFVRDDMLKVSSSKCQDKVYILKPSTKCILQIVVNITNVLICKWNNNSQMIITYFILALLLPTFL